MKIGIHNTVIGNLGAGEWLWMPWNMGDGDAEINFAVDGMTCINPMAPLWLLAFSLNLDS